MSKRPIFLTSPVLKNPYFIMLTLRFIKPCSDNVAKISIVSAFSSVKTSPYLSRYVPEDFMSTCMENSRSAKEALDRLIRAALLAGAPDNISAVCGFPVDAADRI